LIAVEGSVLGLYPGTGIVAEGKRKYGRRDEFWKLTNCMCYLVMIYAHIYQKESDFLRKSCYPVSFQ